LRRLPGKLDLVAAAFAAKEPDDLAVVTFCGRLDTDEASERHAGEIDFPLSLLGFFRRRRPLDTFANRLTLSRSDRHFLRFGRLATSSAGAPRILTVKPIVAERRPPKPEAEPETRPSGAGVLAAADRAARTEEDATLVQEGMRGGTAGAIPAIVAPSAANEPGASGVAPALE